MKRNDAEDEDQRQHQHNDGIDLQTRRFVRVEPEHGAAAAAGTGSARAAWPSICNFLLLISRCASPDRGTRATWRRRGGRSVDARAAGGRGRVDWG